MQLLMIDGSYRQGGITDQAVALAADTAEAAGTQVEVVHLRDVPIGFCRNCRECTQRPGAAPGDCVQHDAMAGLVAKIEAADGYLLASPTNFASATALFKRFMERLIVYAYWPWGMHAPRRRKARAIKPVLLVTSSAAPGPLARLLYTTPRQLAATARTIGARPVATLCIGRVSDEPQARLPEPAARRLRRQVVRLLS